MRRRLRRTFDDVSSTKVLLDPKRWGVFIHHGPAAEVTVNAFVLRSEFQHRFVSLSVSSSKEEQERAVNWRWKSLGVRDCKTRPWSQKALTGYLGLGPIAVRWK